MAELRYPFTVAVVGSADVMTPDELERLLALLVNRHADTHTIVLVGTDRGPELRWCQDRGWSFHYSPCCRQPVRRDCDLVVQADALVVLGDPAPWWLLLDLCRRAKIPTRVYRERPRLPAPREYDPEGR